MDVNHLRKSSSVLCSLADYNGMVITERTEGGKTLVIISGWLTKFVEIKMQSWDRKD